MRNPKRVLVVDDEQGMRELLEIVLGGDGYEVVCLATPEDAQPALQRQSFDVVVTDLRIGSDAEAGMRFLSWLQEFAPGTPAIMMTAHGSVETAIEAMKRGAADYVLKPFQNDEIRLLVGRAIDQRELVRENRALRKEQAKLGNVTNMVGASPSIEQVKEMIRRVAVLPSTIAIYGESGTGKELVARSLHQLSERAEKPFIAINCGGIPENLLESELFGHKRGTFTGAFEDKDGLFFAADGGTLFLDEIGEMPLSLQVKLLRVLDNNIITPLGGTESIQVDVRIVSATNHDLEEMVQEGEFREDLYYRLNVIPLVVPSLRERADDIPLLVRHFVELHGGKLGRGNLEVTAEANNLLCAYPWPGNVRELGNVIERAVALCMSDTIDLSELPQNVREYVPGPSGAVTELPQQGVDLEGLIEEIEIKLIQEALSRTKHSQKKAAQLLGLTARSLRYRLQKYGLGSAAETVEV
ncbi:MAG: sigma-54-dependent Fis family transcriptional regulator [Candidatus Hydrogenedentes bacterium]|nr:sigma-54-dependent Fis family transcriptional regulator [Candidatus Hydrogenedentota bacterium]